MKSDVSHPHQTIIAARAILAPDQAASWEDARTIGQVAYRVAKEGEEAEVLIGMALAAKDAGDEKMLVALNVALKSLGQMVVYNPWATQEGA